MGLIRIFKHYVRRREAYEWTDIKN
jgi:hypothetical protein